MVEEAAELLDVPVEEVDLPLTDSIDRELRKLTDEKQVCIPSLIRDSSTLSNFDFS